MGPFFFFFESCKGRPSAFTDPHTYTRARAYTHVQACTWKLKLSLLLVAVGKIL